MDASIAAPGWQRQLPHNVDAEMALLGAILVNNRAFERVSDVLRPEHFALAEHTRIFEACSRLLERGQVADPVTLKAWFEQDEALAAVGGVGYLMRLGECATTTINAGEYGRLVHDLYLRRELIGLGENVVNRAYTSDVDEGAQQQIEQAAASLLDLDERAARSAPSPLPRFDRFDLAPWCDTEPPALGFAIADLAPLGMVTLLAAEGGAGKTLLQQLALTCVANGLPFLGKATVTGAAAGLFAEDPDEVLHLRQRRICDELGVDLRTLQGRLLPISFAGHDAVLWRDGERTSLFRSMERQLAGIQDLRLVAVDNAALVFGDDENDRGSVTRFMAALNGLAARLGAAVLLSTHKAKSSDGSTLRAASGSTAWINAARSVLELSPGNAEKDDPPSLRLLKANHTKPGERLTLRWRNSVLGVDAPAGGLVGAIGRRNRAREAEEAFLACLDAALAQGRGASATPNVSTYAPKMFSKMAEGREFCLRDLESAMERLFGRNIIHVTDYKKSNRHLGQRIERAGEAA